MSFRILQPKDPKQSAHSNDNVILPIDHPESVRRRKFRHWFEVLLKASISLGGYSVIAAIGLIFFFLLLQIWPLMNGAKISQQTHFQLPESTSGSFSDMARFPAYTAIEEQGKVAGRFYQDGRIQFFNTSDGSSVHKAALTIPENVSVSSISASDPVSGLLVYGLDNGKAILIKHHYKITFVNEQRMVTPLIEYPLGETPIVVDPQGQVLEKIALEKNEQEVTIVAWTQNRRLILKHINLNHERFSITEGAAANDNHNNQSPDDYKSIHQTLDSAGIKTADRIDFLLLSKTQENLSLIVTNEQGESWLHFYYIKDKNNPAPAQRILLGERDNPVTAASFLTGGISLIIGKQSGEMTQWFPVNRENLGFQLTEIRRFKAQSSAIVQIVPEPERKGFYAIDKSGYLGIYHATSNANLLVEAISGGELAQLAVTKRAHFFLIQQGANSLSLWSVDNKYPEISWQTLWGKVWYESYSEPDYVWQSSSANNDFEPKFSLTPLALGTLKAAFYAMLFATPLAIMGAIYTAYFMNARMRNLVKPTIEIMEALPTVIIGFLAGLWLAPFVDDNLFAVLSLLFALPIGVLLSAWLWHILSLKHVWYSMFKTTVPEGWEALILTPVILAIIWGTTVLCAPLEQWLFAGSLQGWLSNELGVDFDQRNSIIVGIAMGFAVIPTIFSITEDAVFNVPGHLTNGSMALGATRWQTLIRVVILTASPAIFSAIMIGLGRAIGETMIVLMATGNTPIMDFSIFQGMRTLSANVAIEIPESEMASSHYRILFLAAFILFLFTFFFNTIAEIIRQRLRRNYSKL